MNTEMLGRRIKEARLAKKMTQAEVVGNFITRNMLSQIESGIATPSMKTLEYIAGVLDLSLPEIMAQSETDGVALLLSAKAAYKAGNFDRVISEIGEPSKESEVYDELCALLSLAYKNRASNSDQPENDLKLSFLYSQLGIYSDK